MTRYMSNAEVELKEPRMAGTLGKKNKQECLLSPRSKLHIKDRSESGVVHEHAQRERETDGASSTRTTYTDMGSMIRVAMEKSQSVFITWSLDDWGSR